MNEKEPLLSVIVPVYNTEKFIRKCLDSIINQTYKNIEIIIVNDGSLENENETIKEYIEINDRIRVIQHQENRGLFQARITGMESAKGEYFAFVDSDDSISIDYYRLLMKKATETGSDIVVGEWCFEYENARKKFLNFEHFRYADFNLNGEEAFDNFMRQKGVDFSWHTVWNKIYKKRLWDSCASNLKEFSQSHGHMIMCEDIVLSCNLWYEAGKVTNVHGVNYLYQIHDSQSTKISQKSKKTILKIIDDTAAAFDFFEKLIRKQNVHHKYKEDFEFWKSSQAVILYNNLKENPDIKKYERYLKDKFAYDGVFKNKKVKEKKEFIYQVETTVEDCYNWLEDTKNLINSDKIEYVSFDIFDTVIQRPFVEPTDLFYLLNKHFLEILNSSAYIDFAQIRIAAEQKCRKILELSRRSCEEIKLEEIYAQIAEDYMFEESLLNDLMGKEIELEKRFCNVRKMGRELYELALHCGKKVIFTSDIYLPKNTVEEILYNNGYCEYEKLYLSSEIKMTKHSKNLYKYILDELQIEKHNSILHIGDNYIADIENARFYRLSVLQMSKSMDIFKNLNPNVYTGDHFKKIIESNLIGGINDLTFTFSRFHGFRNMIAVTANKIYDNPYQTYNTETDFNTNPYFIGYYPLGMYLYSVLTWLINNVEDKNIKTIHFVARDGYLVKKAYDLYKSKYPEKISQNRIIYIFQEKRVFCWTLPKRKIFIR